MAAPVLTVYGALGRQGAGVITAFESAAVAGHYQLRALTSNPSSAEAVALASKPNIQVVKVDVNSIDSLRAAFEGSAYIFANTSFSGKTAAAQSPAAAEKEEATQGLNIVKAAAHVQSSLQHFIWSAFPDAKEQTRGKHNIPHIQAKAPPEQYILGHPTLSKITTFLRVGFYDSNVQMAPYTPFYSVS